MRKAADKLARWRLRLLEFYFDVLHYEGMKNQETNSFLRLKTGGGGIKTLRDEIAVVAIFDQDTKNESLKDDYDEEDSDKQ